MFQESFVAPRKELRRQAVAFPLAVLLHLGVILTLVLGPLIRNVDLPRWTVLPALLVPPPPVPALPAVGHPRPAGHSARIQPLARRAALDPGRLIAPFRIPDTIAGENVGDISPRSDLYGWDEGGPSSGFPTDPLVDQIIETAAGLPDISAPPVVVVRPPRLVKRVNPEYPEIARLARVSGEVRVEATTDVFGRVTGVRVVGSIPLLDQAAVDAVRQWVYEPMVVNGRPRSVSFIATVKFVLQ